MTLITCEGLRKKYQDRCVVDGITFEIKEQQTVVLVGESGSGKTTLLRLLACLLEPDEGRIRLQDQWLGFYAQYLVKGHPVAENIAYALRFYDKEFQQERVAKLLDLLGLAHVAQSKPKQLSGGEQQRIALAQAIAEPPKVLLLDEPFSHLDSLNKQLLKQYLSEVFEKEQITCLMVTHDLIDAIGMGQRIGIMHRGKLLQMGTFEDLYHRPTDPYVKDFLEAGLSAIRAVMKKVG
jgi:ABC-type Fe3+/spermidine/putrescine transport system ATPase subunit